MKLTHTKITSAQAGFSLIEVMVALALGAIILLGVSEIFTDNSRTRNEIERTGRQIESGAYALRLIEGDLANAAYWGEAAEQPSAGTLPPVCPGLGTDLAIAANELQAAMGYPIQGQDTLGTNCITPKTGTDFIAVRRANSCALSTTECEAWSNNFHLQVSACLDDAPAVELGEIKTASVLGDLTYKQRDCSTLAPIYRMLSRIYFINSSDVLVRAELNRPLGTSTYAETPLVEGVELLKFEYGMDTSGDGQIDDPNTPTGSKWSNVAMVRISMVIRNLKPTTGYTDTKTYTVAGEAYTVPTARLSHKRQLYTRTVSIRNVAGRREVQ
jgi:type IV pilus assembly protein PilW